MNAQKYLEMLREIKSVAFATVDKNGSPQVRIADVMIVDNNGLYFTTARGKGLYKEIVHQKEVAIVGMTKDYQMIKLSGKVKDIGREWIDVIFEQNPILSNVYPENTREILDPFYVYDIKGEFFDLSSGSVKIERFTSGESPKEYEQFNINDKCIKCGICKENCPTGCIQEGNPYIIDTISCLRCGNCFEKCPVGAVERLVEKC